MPGRIALVALAIVALCAVLHGVAASPDAGDAVSVGPERAILQCTALDADRHHHHHGHDGHHGPHPEPDGCPHQCLSCSHAPVASAAMLALIARSPSLAPPLFLVSPPDESPEDPPPSASFHVPRA